MTVVRRNIIANLIGNGWVAIMSYAFIPYYIHFLGIEAYGLIGFYITLQAVMFLLDMGITATVSRELARLSALAHESNQMRDLVRTMEIVYWGIALIVAMLVIVVAPLISEQWLNSKTIAPEILEEAIVLMGLVIAFRMPYGFYSGGLVGLQKQIQFNILKAVIETCRNGGAVLVLWLLSPSIIAFFQWHLFVTGVAACLACMGLWRYLPIGNRPASFNKFIFTSLWRFTIGMSVISISAVILVQMDKVILSRMLSLEQFGYYMLAATIATGITFISGPVFSAIYPKLNQLVALNDELAIKSFYHKSSQLVAVLILPLAVTISVFSEEILIVWTQNELVAENTNLVLSILIIGAAFNGLMQVPYALQLSHGWTSLTIYCNWIAIIILLPLLIWGINTFGPIGGALVWLSLNVGYLLISLPILHRRILTGEMGRWYINDFAYPVVTSVVIIFGSSLLIDGYDFDRYEKILLITVIYLAALVSSVLSASFLRNWCCELFKSILRKYA